MPIYQFDRLICSACAGCGDHLHSGQILLALGTSWHVWCFKCSECAAVLQGEYMSHNGRPLCLRDYNQKFGVKCCECDRFIAGKVLEVLIGRIIRKKKMILGRRLQIPSYLCTLLSLPTPIWWRSRDVHAGKRDLASKLWTLSNNGKYCCPGEGGGSWGFSFLFLYRSLSQSPRAPNSRANSDSTSHICKNNTTKLKE